MRGFFYGSCQTLDKGVFKIFIIGVGVLFVRNSYVFLKFYKICGGSVIKQRNLYSGLLLYLSITEMLRMVTKQCFMRHGYMSYISVGGGMVGFSP